jgi:hypothetical protein
VLDRTASSCLHPELPAQMTYDSVRHGTTSLFAAMDVASGAMIAQHYRGTATRSPYASSSSPASQSPMAWTCT